jgi:hypothetical protein
MNVPKTIQYGRSETDINEIVNSSFRYNEVNLKTQKGGKLRSLFFWDMCLMFRASIVVSYSGVEMSYENETSMLP